MALGDITLACEGEPEGRDIRWLGLAIDALGMARAIDIVPSGSKTNLKGTVAGLRASLRTPRVYAIRDRDFLPSALMTKDLPSGISPLQRHSLESYLVEPDLIEAALGIEGVLAHIEAIAAQRFWLDVGRAGLEDFGFVVREEHPSFGDVAPADREHTVQLVRAKIEGFIRGLAVPDVEALIDRFRDDMRAEPVWTRVKGKALLSGLEQKLRETGALPGGDLEGRLFKWCVVRGPPAPLVEHVKGALRALGIDVSQG